MRHILWDLNGCLVHNNKSIGSGDLPEGYGSDNPDEVVQAYRDGKLPKAYYLTSPDDIIWTDGALDGIELLSDNQYKQFIITNQEHIQMGITSPERWIALMDLMEQQIDAHGGDIDAWYWCPHSPGANCNCRKRTIQPGLHMFYKCALEHDFNLYDSYMIGDNISDAIAGKLAGCITIMVRTPKVYEPVLIEEYVDYIVDNAYEAAQLIVEIE